MIAKIQQIREIESKLLKKFFVLKQLSLSLRMLVPILCSLVCFSVYQSEFEVLTVAKAFSMLTLFTNLLHPVKVFFDSLDNRAAALVSSSRLDKMMVLEDRKELENSQELGFGAVEINGGKFAWTSQEQLKIFKPEVIK
jgi:hypothetical protein